MIRLARAVKCGVFGASGLRAAGWRRPLRGWSDRPGPGSRSRSHSPSAFHGGKTEESSSRSPWRGRGLARFAVTRVDTSSAVLRTAAKRCFIASNGTPPTPAMSGRNRSRRRAGSGCAASPGGRPGHGRRSGAVGVRARARRKARSTRPVSSRSLAASSRSAKAVACSQHERAVHQVQGLGRHRRHVALADDQARVGHVEDGQRLRQAVANDAAGKCCGRGLRGRRLALLLLRLAAATRPASRSGGVRLSLPLTASMASRMASASRRRGWHAPPRECCPDRP